MHKYIILRYTHIQYIYMYRQGAYNYTVVLSYQSLNTLHYISMIYYNIWNYYEYLVTTIFLNLSLKDLNLQFL